MTVAFVLGGGGVRGAVHVGMLQALFEADIHPDLVVGTSIGAINGAAVAADPGPAVVERLTEAWSSPTANEVYGEPWYRQLTRLAKSRTHLYDPAALRRLITGTLGSHLTFDELQVPLVVAAASIERASEHWFDAGSVTDAVLASASVPGALPPTEIDGEHFVDGGMVNSIPLGEAVRRGATTVYVLQVGRVEEPLSVPTKPSDVARVSFEIARRHRYFRELDDARDVATVHVLPSGGSVPGDEKIGAFRKLDATRARIAQSYGASRTYLAGLPGANDEAQDTDGNA